MPVKMTTEGFINKAISVHGNLYDYSLVEYIGSKSHVKIICRDHGVFVQTPNSHLRGNGCKECSYLNKSMTTEEFINAAKKVHGSKYDYSNTVYVKTQVKVEIECNIHGKFKQLPKAHLLGHGCLECGRESKTFTTEAFVKKAIEIHGDAYDYSKVEYKTAKEPVEIVCKIHGSFWQRASAHLYGNRCTKCHPFKIWDSRGRITKSKFLKLSKETHKNFYDYSKVLYKNSIEKVEIICPYHGSFWQSPANHYKGSGCQRCAAHRYGWACTGFYSTLETSSLYVLNFDNIFIKIGLSKDVNRRKDVISKETGFNIKIVRRVEGRAYPLYVLEQTLLCHMGLKKYTPAVPFAGHSECLDISEMDNVMKVLDNWEVFNK